MSHFYLAAFCAASFSANVSLILEHLKDTRCCQKLELLELWQYISSRFQSLIDSDEDPGSTRSVDLNSFLGNQEMAQNSLEVFKSGSSSCFTSATF